VPLRLDKIVKQKLHDYQSVPPPKDSEVKQTLKETIKLFKIRFYVNRAVLVLLIIAILINLYLLINDWGLWGDFV
jgi:hypothetical protein